MYSELYINFLYNSIMPAKSRKKMPCRSCNPSLKKMFNDDIYQSRVKSSEYKDIKNYLPELKDGKCKLTTAKNANKNLKLNLGVKHAKKLVFYFLNSTLYVKINYVKFI